MRRAEGRFALPPDAETQWEQFEILVQNDFQEFFDGEGPISGARAPGRLDVIGGVADYSGSIVLEMPIAEAACVAWQWRSDRLLKIRSLGVDKDGLLPEVMLSMDDLLDVSGALRSATEVQERLSRNPQERWAAYIAGCLYVMLVAYNKTSFAKAERNLGDQGANILVKSDVPLGAGVSSSAAIEVATMQALGAAAGIQPSDLTLAAWCQKVENLIVGAPCGIMDQVTSALGRENALIVLRCQPHDLLGTQQVPPGWRFLGLDSRVKHSVGGAHYTNARVGAFMGLKIIQLESGGKLLENYLCKMSPTEFLSYRERIPESLTGREYQAEYGLLPDTITRVDPEETYRPRACAEHPILENDRVKQFFGLMQIACARAEENTRFLAPDTELMQEAGKLMYAAHASYSDRLNLGSPETDLLVTLIQAQGPANGLFGAKITGGGSGGTVAVLCTETTEAEAALTEVCQEYERRIGMVPRLIIGSSPGAVPFGTRYIMRG